VGNEFAWEIFESNGEIKFRFPSTIDKFVDVFSSCVTSLHDHIFFRKYLLNGMALEYYAADQLERRSVTLATIRDDFAINMIRKNPQDRSMLSNMTDPADMMGDLSGGLESRDQLGMLRSANFQSHFLSTVFYKPVKAPLKRIDENLAIFDFPNGLIRFFDPEGKQFYSVSIDFHLKNIESNSFKGVFDRKEWEAYDIYVDEVLFKAYALFTKGGKYTLKEIDLFTGKINRSIKLYHPYPEKITIRDGYAYFLYKPQSEWTNKRLYKQKL
jgi:hypothetical protein